MKEKIARREPPPHPFLKWVGGKRQLLPELLKAVASAKGFSAYHEPFIGGGALYFRLARTGMLPNGAYLSDINPNLIDAYVGVRDDIEGVLRALAEHERLHSEQHFYAVRASSPRTPARRAARIIYLNRTCFNGLYRENSKGQFNAPFGRYDNPLIRDIANLRAVAETLRFASIHARTFVDALDDIQAGDLVYFDPPYIPASRTAGFTSYSRNKFGLAQQRQLAEAFTYLASKGAKVIASNSFTDLTCDLYAGHYIYEVHATRRVNSRPDRRGAVAEALITSFRVAGLGAPRKRVRARPAEARMDRMLAKQWLLENGYADVAKMIDEVIDEWKADGKATRRNWWDVLAGGTNGKPRKIGGREFAVLRAAQVRQGVPVTPNAISRPDESSEPPASRSAGRWSGDSS
ncbi:MAG: DNA adenine methylase [Gammaproteobacteria bacterium]